tara:strand:- start:1326 stop:2438 length:1113 start_codon:yes stop_codon:yes gene_type:complete
MEISSINMISFRNHENTKISFSPGITIIWGENGSGKTSILEAIHSLSFGSSFRTNNKKELIKDGSNNFLLEGFFKNKKGIENIVFFSQDIKGNKKIKINKKEIQRRKDLLGLNNVVVFSPEEESITKNGPNNRRKFFNKVFSIVSKSYLEQLLNYNSTLEQRNAVLKFGSNEQTNKQIEIWNEPFCQKAEKLWTQRKRLLFEFLQVFKETVKILDLGIKCDISYEQKKTTKEEILKGLEKNRGTEFTLGFTTIGPHRDDFLFKWEGRAIRKHGSQGEHKMFLALLKTTELLFISKKTKKNPVFLIDDIFANLDIDRSKRLLQFIEKLQLQEKTKPQTIITTTDILEVQKEGFFSNYSKIKKHKIQVGETT